MHSSKFSRKLRMSQLLLPIRHHSPSTTIVLECRNGGGPSQMRQPSFSIGSTFARVAQSTSRWSLCAGITMSTATPRIDASDSAVTSRSSGRK